MLKGLLINSTSSPSFETMAQTSTPSLNTSQAAVSVAALLKPTGRGLREGDLNKPDLLTYLVMFLILFLLVVLIVFFINCQLKNSFFMSLPYDRSLREARNSWRTARV
ncbi:small integral membrane protein 32-like [Polypterus senegalus]